MKKFNKKIKRRLRNRKRIKKLSTNKLRISVNKSLKNLSAQIIDDKLNKTLVSASSIEKAIKSKKAKKMAFYAFLCFSCIHFYLELITECSYCFHF